MENEIIYLFERWDSSIDRYGKLDSWTLNKDFCKIGSFLKQCKDRTVRAIVSKCRDMAIDSRVSVEKLSEKIKNTVRKLKQCAHLDEDDGYEIPGQRDRYRSITKSLYRMRVKCAGNRYLRNLDVNLLPGKKGRQVRRIVEKCMCQEFYRQHKDSFREGGNRSRQNMRRAVSYQLYNLGRIEAEDCTRRKLGTHWKWVYDSITENWVQKPKVGYNTLEEAEAAREEFYKDHMDDGYEVHIYKCAYCGKYHIGHYHPGSEYEYAPSLTSEPA